MENGGLDVTALPDMSDDEMVARLKGIVLDHETKWFYRAWLERRLVGCWCRACETWSLPVRRFCPNCWSTLVTIRDLSGQGHVFTATHLLQPYPFAAMGPKTSASATIELAEQPGLRFASEIIDTDTVRVGMPVTVTWVEVDGLPCPFFRPVDERNAAPQ